MRKESFYRSQLNSLEKFLWVSFNFVFALIPMLMYFAWIERNLNFRYVYPSIVEPIMGPLVPEFPWYRFPTWELRSKLLWNFVLVTGWGIIHSLFAQHHIHQFLAQIFPLPALRTVYVMITGFASWLVMTLWQPTEIIVWQFFSPEFCNLLNFVLSYSFVAAQTYILMTFNVFEFFGVAQLIFGIKPTDKTAGTKELKTTGIYGLIRHPVYFFVLMNIFFTPFMTLDRLLFGIANLIFLLWAIPIEEIKLEKEFGPAYHQYRQKVPAIIPYIF